MQTLARMRDLVLLRAGPQDMPYAPRGLIALIAIGFTDLMAAVIVAAGLGG